MPKTLPTARPAMPAETLRGTPGLDAPLIALFPSDSVAGAALRHAGATLLRKKSAGVVMLAPGPGLREKLYAAGAMLVVS